MTVDRRRRPCGHGLAPRRLAGFDPLESKLRPPPRRGRSVPRADLIDRLEHARATPTVVVSAGPGWGKTTLLTQWASRGRRPFAWVSVDARDNDPTVFLSYVATALDRVVPLGADVFAALASPGVPVETTVVPRLTAALARSRVDTVLVLDDLHLIDDPRCLGGLTALTAHLPECLQVVIATRGPPAIPVEVMRTQGFVLEIGADDLGLSPSEASRMLRAMGIPSTPGQIAELVDATEGWPAGMQLATRCAVRGIPGAPLRVAGDDRRVAEYLRSEVLAHLSSPERSFLASTSFLDRLSGPLCDAVLDRRGSAAMLEALTRSTGFLVALDATRSRYRYRRLFREFLRSESGRGATAREPVLRTRAIEWCEANGKIEEAIAYAQAAGDVDRVARLVDASAVPTYYGGRVATVEGWLAWLQARGALESRPTLVVLAGLVATVRGESGQADRLTAVAGDARQEGALPDGSASIGSWRTLLRAQRGADGVAAMRVDAERAVRTLAAASSHRPNALMLLGIATLLQGDVEEADDLLAEVVEEGTERNAPDTAAVALAERAAIATRRDAWGEAEALAERSLALLPGSRPEDYAPHAFVYAVAGRVAQNRGSAHAGALLARAQRMRPRLTDGLPYLAVQTRLELARADLARADTGDAEEVCREIDALLRRQPELGVLGVEARELRRRLETIRAVAPGTSTLTAAELRVLPYLETHLSFREIGARLHVSPHTVKSHAVAIYRKLGVTSRVEAVRRAHVVGLR